VRGHSLIISTGRASLQDAGCRCMFSGGVARAFDTAGLGPSTKSVRPFRARMMCGLESCSRVIFSQKSPFALTVHTFGVRKSILPKI
jgi:hypothetical protein